VELLLPRTDAGVLVQAIAVGIVTVLAVGLSWRRAEIRTFLGGTGFLLLTLMALRTLH